MGGSFNNILKNVLLFVFPVLFLLAGESLSFAQGLIFSRDPDNTSMELFPKRKPVLRGTVTIDFDLEIFDPDVFGQVVVFNRGGNAISLSYISKTKEDAGFVLNSLNDKTRLIDIPCNKASLSPARWQHISLSVIPSEEAVELTLSGRKYRLVIADLPKSGPSRITFGSSKQAVIDSPIMALKSIRVTDNRRSYEWPLGEYEGSLAMETGGHRSAVITNAQWLKSFQHNWSKIKEFSADYAAGLCFKEETSELFIVSPDSLTAYSPGSGAERRMQVGPPNLDQGYSGEAVYDRERDCIYYYNLINDGSFARPFMDILDCNGKVLSKEKVRFSNALHHHAYAFYPENRKLYIFGGYGNYSYSDRIFCYDFDNNDWQQVDYTGDHIPARMHTVSSVTKDGKMLIFGGVGNVVGRQELGKEFYFDLYAFNPQTREVNRLWNRPNPKEDADLYIPTRGIIVHENNNALYILCRSRHKDVYLRRFNADHGSSEAVSNNLPDRAASILSSYYLFYDEAYSKMYAVERDSDEDTKRAKITVWSIDTPPVVAQPQVLISRRRILPWCISALVLILAVVLYFLLRPKAKAIEPVLESTEEHLPPNTIRFFGGFTVIDRDGNNITERFGIKIKQMLVIIMLYSEIGKGINTVKLSTSIWPEKTSSDAKNIRGVTMNHLRTLLKELDGISIDYVDGKWVLETGPDLEWDFAIVKSIAREIISSTDGKITKERSSRFLDMLSRGPILPRFVQYDWFDNIKLDCEEAVLKAAERLLAVLYDSGDVKEALRCADVVLSIDRLDEQAIDYKLKCLRRMGRQDFAKDVEARFHALFKAQDE